jgi:hypothetical protein
VFTIATYIKVWAWGSLMILGNSGVTVFDLALKRMKFVCENIEETQAK